MQQRKLGPFNISAIGVGCMNLSHIYGPPPNEESAQDLLLRALDLGYTHFDTAALYGFGSNEILLGKTLSGRRDEFILASKCGMDKNEDGQREICGRPDVLRKTLEKSLKQLQTDVIDLYYLHRLDKSVPIEDSVGALADFVAEGKIKTIGLSEVSAATLRKAHAVHPIAAMQSEYSLWTRNPEIAVLDTCAELGVSFVAFSPLARAFLTGTLRDVSQLSEKDLRRQMPRFDPQTYAKNLQLLDGFGEVASVVGCTMGQLALAWVLAKGDHIIALPGTKNPDHLAENYDAGAIHVSEADIARIDRMINQKTIVGDRYKKATQAEIDTEEFE